MLYLQLWGGGFYLLNKIFFALTEHAEGERQRLFRIWSWIFYLIGTPAVVWMFILQRNWIFAGLEAGGILPMLMGLVVALRKPDDNLRVAVWIDRLVYFGIALGITYSVYDFGGINTINQALEIGAIVGFLPGTYMLAKKDHRGYLWYLFMFVCTGWLLWIEHLALFAVQQIVSFICVFDAYVTRRKKSRAQSLAATS